jgi:hypothetical protein
MSAPRPPGVRRAYFEEARLVLQLTSLPTLGPPVVLDALGVRRAAARASPTLRTPRESSSTRIRSYGRAQRRR